MTPQTEAAGPVAVLSDDESWDLISGVHLGRLVTVLEGRPEIFPVNFVVQRRTILFRSAEGTKLFSTVMNDHVLFEADDHGVAEGWSVIVRGTAELLYGSDDIQEAEKAGLNKVGDLRAHLDDLRTQADKLQRLVSEARKLGLD